MIYQNTSKMWTFLIPSTDVIQLMLTMGWLPHRLSKHSQSYSGLRSPGWSYSTYLCHNHFVIIIFLTFLFKVKIYQVISVQIVVVDDVDDDYLSSLTITITTTITLLKELT